MSKKPIVVIGSINMDLVCRTAQMPKPGETVLGSDLQTIPGGKGANQAVAAAKLGEEVHMVGRVGEDDFGERLLNGLQQHKVNTDHVTITEGVASGCAMILVDKKGENSIVVVPGANAKVTAEDVDAAAGVITSAAVVIMQLEIPLKTAEHAAEVCRRAGVPIILDPTPVPAKGLPKSLYQVDYLTPNQNEAESLLERRELGRMKRTKRPDARQLAERLLERGPERVVLKLGPKGAVVMDNEVEHIKGYKVRVVDTTAAGDAFTAALAVGVAEGMELGRAVRFANAAGAKCCETFGAQPALPTRMEVEAVMGGIH
jgi:ribokinase